MSDRQESERYDAGEAVPLFRFNGSQPSEYLRVFHPTLGGGKLSSYDFRDLRLRNRPLCHFAVISVESVA